MIPFMSLDRENVTLLTAQRQSVLSQLTLPQSHFHPEIL